MAVEDSDRDRLATRARVIRDALGVFALGERDHVTHAARTLVRDASDEALDRLWRLIR